MAETSLTGAPVRFGGYLDRCGRPVVGRYTDPLSGTYDACEGCCHSDEFGPPLTFEATTSYGTNGNGYWVACECACGHIAGARIEDMDRTGRHLRCPACLVATHPAEERAPGSFLEDPRVGRRGS